MELLFLIWQLLHTIFYDENWYFVVGYRELHPFLSEAGHEYTHIHSQEEINNTE